MKLIKLWPFVRRRRGFFLLIFLSTLAVSMLGALQPWPVKLVVDHVLGGAPWPSWMRQALGEGSFNQDTGVLLVWVAAGGFLLYLAVLGLELWLAWLWIVTGRAMVNELAEEVFGHLQRRSGLFHSKASVGDLMSRVSGDSWCVHQAVDVLFFAPLHAVLGIGMMITLMWKLQPGLAMWTMVTAPVVVGVSLTLGKPLRRAARDRRELEGVLHSHLQQTLTGMPVVQAYVQEEREQARFRGYADAAIRARQRGAWWGGLNQLSSGLVATLGTGWILWLGSREVLDGRLSVGSLLVFLAYLGSLQAQVKVLAGLYAGYQGMRASADRVLSMLEAKLDLPEVPHARPLDRVRGRVTLERVTTGYESGRPVLSDVNLELAPGEVVALVGSTGAGKSTLAGLVPRFLDPWEGTVRLDSVDVRERSLASVRAQVSVLFQEPYLLPISVGENIGLGRPGATRAEIEAAARAAQAHEFIARMPSGYDSVLGERGGTLSGGERQRVALARAFLKNAPILIVDEPTSALDAETEHQVMEALRRWMAGRTTLLIAHRLSTVQQADRVVVLEKGRVVEAGPPAALAAAGGVYSRYWAGYRQETPAASRGSGSR